MAAKRQQSPTPEHPPLMCATAGCPYDARVRVRRRRAAKVADKPNPAHVEYGAWLNLCHACNDRQIREGNVEYCRLMGLDTAEKQKTWCRAQIKRGVMKIEPPISCEPGEDPEEAAA